MPVSPKLAVQHFVQLFVGFAIEVRWKLRTRAPNKELVNIAIAGQLSDTPVPPDNQIETVPNFAKLAAKCFAAKLTSNIIQLNLLLSF